MTMLADHGMAFLLVILVPLWGQWSWLRLQRAVAQGKEDARLTAYAETILMEWGLATVVLVMWIALQRDLSALGLDATLARGFVITSLIVLALSVLFLVQARAAGALSGDTLESLRAQMESVRTLLPHNAGERAVFLALALTAGFCEELLYRGFLIGYLAEHLGTPAAVGLSSIIFGLLHAYQGKTGIVKTGAVGLAMGLIYVLSGSIWPAVVFHAAFDIQGGLMGYAVFGREAS